MELRDYIRGLRRHWFAIVLMAALGVGVGWGWAQLQTPVYEASATGYVQSRDTEDVGGSIVGDAAARSKVASYLDVAGWRITAENAISELGLNTTPESIVQRVTVVNTQDTVILKVTARASTAEDARALAEQWISSMAYSVDQVEGDGTEGSSPVTIITIGSASLPSSPIFPDPRTALIVGGLVGLGFGVAFALMRTASDRRVRAGDEVEEKTGVALVGAIPVTEGMDGDNRLIGEATGKVKGKGRNSNFAVSEAMRSLRTNLQFMDVDNPPRTIVVTSPLPGDGKSTIACNLAITLAASGQPVVLVDGDLRRSAVAKTMGLPGGAGLTDVLSGRAELSDVLQRTPRAKNLYVLAAGSIPPNPSEVLGSERMRSLLVDLAAHALVIIDAPPLLPVTDGAVLTHQSDGALLVVSIGKTTYDLVEKALDALQKASGRALGIVLNRVPTRGLDASPYSYEYRREYGTPKLDSDTANPAKAPDEAFDLEAIFGAASAEGDVDARRQRARRT